MLQSGESVSIMQTSFGQGVADFTLAHISDLHLPLPAGFGPRHWNVKRGLGYINWHRGRRFVHKTETVDKLVADMRTRAPAHVAVTGDLVNIGLPVEYEAARSWLESLGAPEHITVVPGNHDIYVHLRRDPGVGRWISYMEDDAWGRAASLPKASAAVMDGVFPFVRRVGPVALIGLNSAVPTRPFVAAGRLGAAQLTALRETLRATKAANLVRVVLIHHPPMGGLAPRLRGLVDAPDLERLLAEEGAELVLHGHNHRDAVAHMSMDNGGRIPVVGICSGSASRRHHGEALARYNLLHFSRHANGSIRVVLEGRGLAAPGGDVVELEKIELF